jgi:APA family basic amino acid/polyamine antiporter
VSDPGPAAGARGASGGLASLSAPGPSSGAAAAGKLGLGMAVALVVGNIIGSGVYLVPASLAPYGRNSLSAWLLTAAGGVVVALVFAALSRALPEEGGLYAYTRAAFGERAGFVVAWGYWVSIWVGNAAIATGAVSYTSVALPWIVNVPGAALLVTLAVIWALTFVNCLGVRAAGWVQVVTTVLKLMPLLAIAAVGLFFVRGELVTAHAGVPLSLEATTAAATLTLWALLGLESATVPADKVHDPARTIPRATMIGTLVSAAVCAVSCSIVLVVVPQATLATSNAPFADAAEVLFGGGARLLVAAFAAISAYGALNGWILLQGELPSALARDGLFPRAFGRLSRRGAPVLALVATSVLVSGLVLMNAHKTLVEVFTFMILISTTATLVAYLTSSLSLIVLLRRGRVTSARAGWLAGLAAVAALYSLWAIVGAGRDAVLWGALLIVAALPVHALMRTRAA